MIFRIFAIIRKEFLHIGRDRPTLALIFLIPIIQMTLLGYAATTNVENIKIGVWDQDQSETSRRVINAFDATDAFAVSRYVLTDEQAHDLLDTGETRAVLIVPENFEQDLKDGEKVEIEMLVDGSDPTVANGMIAGALKIGQALIQQQALGGVTIRPQPILPADLQSVPPCPSATQPGQPATSLPPVTAPTPLPAGANPILPPGVAPSLPGAAAGPVFVPCIPAQLLASLADAKPPAAPGGMRIGQTVLYNPDLKSVNYMIPALMGMILQFLATLVTSMAIVRERERGTIEQLIVTPITSLELVIGKIAPYVLLAFVDFLEVLVIGVFWFKVPINGDLGLLMALSALFLLGALGMGIMVSTAARTQQEAMLMSFLILFPSIFLSGFFFPLDAMPVFLRALSYFIPLRYMLAIIRGLVIKGVGFEALRSEVMILAAFCVLILLAAARRFRASLD